MSTKRKRSKTSSRGNDSREDILTSLESSDRAAAKLRKYQMSTETLPRSFAAKSQVEIHTNLIECRILIQQALSSVNNVVREDDDDIDENRNGLDELLNKLITARRQLCFSNDEEVESDSESETDSGSDSEVEEDDEDSKNDKRLAKEYSKLRTNWKETLNKHHANINLQNQQNKNKFQVIDQSLWAQVESNVKHSVILDHAHINDGDDKEDQEQALSKQMQHDDSKLYQHMLKEYILLSAERGKDDAASAAAERLKRSMKKGAKKKDVDRRASKGRKIRYVVHEKLQNFTFPVSRGTGSGGIMDEDVLFKSMLGGASR